MTQHIIDTDARRASIDQERFQRLAGEELDMLGIFVRFGRHRGNDETRRQPHCFAGQRKRIVLVLEHFQHRRDIKVAALERQRAGIAADDRKPLNAAAPHGLQMAKAPFVALYGSRRQVRESIEQWPEKDAASTAEIDEALRPNPAQNAKYRAHSRQIHGAFESMQLEAGGAGARQQLRRASCLADIRQHAPRIGGGQFLIKAVHLASTSPAHPAAGLKCASPQIRGCPGSANVVFSSPRKRDPVFLAMLLTISTTHQPATDLGFLLHKNPARSSQSLDLAFGQAHMFYPEVGDTRCTFALLLDLNPVELVRGGEKGGGGLLDQYVNDRPYAASSFLSVAIAR